MTILVRDHLTSIRSPSEGITRQVQQGRRSPRGANYLQLFQDNPRNSWLLSHDHSGERPASSRTEAPRDKSGKASSLQDVSNISIDFKTFQVFVDVLLPTSHCVEQCQSFSKTSIFAQSDRQLLSYDHLSECPPCLHHEASGDKSGKSGSFQDVSNICICLETFQLFVGC